mmetsp:Transcript_20374/g.56767  ORF Transcript_20374/g.56767 Transcript_20374/m.56767 type:complete len:246 (+) Transcript_20374:2002-2739(+)
MHLVHLPRHFVLLSLPQCDLIDACGKLQGTSGLLVRGGFGRDVHEHHDLGLSRQAVRQQLRELAVAEGHVLLLVGQGGHHITQGREGAVDVVGLHQAIPFCLTLVIALAACQVDQVQAPMRARPCQPVVPIHYHREHLVAPAAALIHLGLGGVAVARALSHHLQHILCGLHHGLGRVGHVAPAGLRAQDVQLGSGVLADQQVAQGFVVDLKHLGLDLVGHLRGALITQLEQVVQCAVVDPAPAVV